MMHDPELKRALGLFDATMISLGAIIGAGIFVATGVAAGIAGWWLPVAFLLAAIPAVFNALSAAANAVVLATSGGTYVFARELLSPIFGFIAGWLFVFATVVSDAVIALGIGAYMNSIVPYISIKGVALLVVALVVIVNYFGLRVVASLNNAFTITKLLVLVFFVIMAVILFANGTVAAPNPSPSSIGNVLAASALLFFAYPGYARITTIAEEIRDPHRTIPLAVVLGLGISIFIYIIVSIAALVLVGPIGLASSIAPLVTAISVGNAMWPVIVMAVGGVLATGSVFLVDLTGLSRVILAMARYGDVPMFLSEISPRRAVPGRAIVVAGIVIGLLVLFIDVSALIAATSLALLWYYVLTNASAYRLGSLRPFPALIPLLGIASCLCLTAFIPVGTLVLGVLVVAVSIAAYVLKNLVLSHRKSR